MSSTPLVIRNLECFPDSKLFHLFPLSRKRKHFMWSVFFIFLVRFCAVRLPPVKLPGSKKCFCPRSSLYSHNAMCSLAVVWVLDWNTKAGRTQHYTAVSKSVRFATLCEQRLQSLLKPSTRAPVIAVFQSSGKGPGRNFAVVAPQVVSKNSPTHLNGLWPMWFKGPGFCYL